MNATMPEVMPVYYMRSSTGRKIACRSIRPGMRIRAIYTWTVVQNSAKLQKIELSGTGDKSFVRDYTELSQATCFTVLPPSLWFRLKRWFSRR